MARLGRPTTSSRLKPIIRKSSVMRIQGRAGSPEGLDCPSRFESELGRRRNRKKPSSSVLSATSGKVTILESSLWTSFLRLSDGHHHPSAVAVSGTSWPSLQRPEEPRPPKVARSNALVPAMFLNPIQVWPAAKVHRTVLSFLGASVMHLLTTKDKASASRFLASSIVWPIDGTRAAFRLALFRDRGRRHRTASGLGATNYPQPNEAKDASLRQEVRSHLRW
jgi:hypothetical protein